MTREEANAIAASFAGLDGGDLQVAISDQLMYGGEIVLSEAAIRAISQRILTLTEIASQNALVSIPTATGGESQ